MDVAFSPPKKTNKKKKGIEICAPTIQVIIFAGGVAEAGPELLALVQEEFSKLGWSILDNKVRCAYIPHTLWYTSEFMLGGFVFSLLYFGSLS